MISIIFLCVSLKFKLTLLRCAFNFCVLDSEKDEIILPKTSSGVFNSTNIDYVLRNLDIRFLIIFGVVTDQCVDMAVRDAADRGYLVTMVSDASATISEERHQNALEAFSGYCRILRTNEVLDEMIERDPKSKKIFEAYKKFKTSFDDWSKVSDKIYYEL